jgi:hypothetical protein
MSVDYRYTIETTNESTWSKLSEATGVKTAFQLLHLSAPSA